MSFFLTSIQQTGRHPHTHARRHTHRIVKKEKKACYQAELASFFCLFFFSFLSFSLSSPSFSLFPPCRRSRCECVYRVSVYMHYKNNNKRVKSSGEELLAAAPVMTKYTFEEFLFLSLSLWLTCGRKGGRFR